jgi:capsular polysaccharide biosynthesis protein
MTNKFNDVTLNIFSIKRGNLPVGPLQAVKNTWVGRFYRKYLKSIPFFQALFIKAWALLLPVYSLIILSSSGSRSFTRWRQLISLREFVDLRGLNVREVYASARVEMPVPQVLPVEDARYLKALNDHDVFPSIYVAELGPGLIVGGTNLVYLDDTVICHDLYDFRRDSTSEEQNGLHLIDSKFHRIRVLHQDPNPEPIQRAASFVDACAANYAHWLTEVLPRIAVFCEIEIYSDIPIVVNDGLHPNIMQSLGLIAGGKRPLITLPLGRALRVEMLIQTSVTGYVPFARRSNELDSHSHGLFNPMAFDLLYKGLNKCIQKNTNLPSKIYLKRSSGHRNVVNSEELEAVLIEKGYVIVDPCNLDFVEQLNYICNATHVVGPTGAALANLIFNRQCSTVVVLMGKHANMSYRYWANMLQPLGLNVKYVLGEQLKQNEPTIHGGFWIDPDAVRELA